MNKHCQISNSWKLGPVIIALPSRSNQQKPTKHHGQAVIPRSSAPKHHIPNRLNPYVRAFLSFSVLLIHLSMAINAANKDCAAAPTFGNETRGHEADNTAEPPFHLCAKNQVKYTSRKGIGIQKEGMASWAGTPAVKGSTESMRMALLTFSLVGLQCVSSFPIWIAKKC
jgi:hypothetical protein